MTAYLTLYPELTLTERFKCAAVTFDLVKRIKRTAKRAASELQRWIKRNQQEQA